MLGLSEATTKRLVAAGALKAAGKRGRGWCFEGGALAAFLRGGSRRAMSFEEAAKGRRLDECVAILLDQRVAGLTLGALLDALVAPAFGDDAPAELIDRLHPLGEPERRRRRTGTALLASLGGLKAQMAAAVLRAKGYEVLVLAEDGALGDLVGRSRPSILWLASRDEELERSLQPILLAAGTRLLAESSMLSLERLLDGP